MTIITTNINYTIDNSSRNTAKRYFSATLNLTFFNVTYSIYLREKYPFITLSLSLFISVCHLFYFYPLSLTLSNSVPLSFCRLFSASLSPSLLLCQSNFWISCVPSHLSKLHFRLEKEVSQFRAWMNLKLTFRFPSLFKIIFDSDAMSAYERLFTLIMKVSIFLR